AQASVWAARRLDDARRAGVHPASVLFGAGLTARGGHLRARLAPGGPHRAWASRRGTVRLDRRPAAWLEWPRGRVWQPHLGTGHLSMVATSTRIDPITFEVVHGSLIAICRHMASALRRTAYSPIIHDMADFSCAIIAPNTSLVAQQEGCP